MKKIIIIALMLTAVLAVGMSACAEAEWDNEALFAGYVSSLFNVPSADARYVPRNMGGDFTGRMKYMYDTIKAGILDIAAGRRTSTVITLDMDWDEIAEDDYYQVWLALLADHPYELYWHDITKGYYWDGDGNGTTTFTLYTSNDYAIDDQTVDPARVLTAQQAVKNAEDIVTYYAGASDLDKLNGYKDEICALVKYNDPAWKEGWDYGDPWQLVWAFDGDPETDIVCEGYSKAFQYLCDMSEFSGDVCCYTVTGYVWEDNEAMDEEEDAHMWNILRMPDGKNYHVDITWCDSDDLAGRYDLFLRGFSSGDLNKGYNYDCRSRDWSHVVHYMYDDDVTDLFPASDLRIASADYIGDIAINATRFPDAAFRQWVSQNCDFNQSGGLSPYEIEQTTRIDVTGSGIGSLKGVELFGGLEILQCAENTLKALDISANVDLIYLDCADNPDLKALNLSSNAKLWLLSCERCGLTALDVRSNTDLYAMRCYGNSIRSLDVSKNKGLTELDCSDNQLSTLKLADNIVLERLCCYYNDLQTLDLRGCTILLDYISPIYFFDSDATVQYGVFEEDDDGVINMTVGIDCDASVNINGGYPVIHDMGELLLPAGLKNIEAEAFMGISAQTVVVPEGCVSIGSRAFANCKMLRFIHIPESVTTLNDHAFDGCDVFCIITDNVSVQKWADDHDIYWYSAS